MSGPSFTCDGSSRASGGPAPGEAGSGGQAQPRRPGAGTQHGPGGQPQQQCGPGEGGYENWSWGPQGCEGQPRQCGPGGDSESWTRPGQKGCGGQPQQCGPGDSSESWSWGQRDCGGQPPHGENRSPCGPGAQPQNRPGCGGQQCDTGDHNYGSGPCEQDVREGLGHGHGGRC